MQQRQQRQMHSVAWLVAIALCWLHKSLTDCCIIYTGSPRVKNEITNRFVMIKKALCGLSGLPAQGTAQYSKNTQYTKTNISLTDTK